MGARSEETFYSRIMNSRWKWTIVGAAIGAVLSLTVVSIVKLHDWEIRRQNTPERIAQRKAVELINQKEGKRDAVLHKKLLKAISDTKRGVGRGLIVIYDLTNQYDQYNSEGRRVFNAELAEGATEYLQYFLVMKTELWVKTFAPRSDDRGFLDDIRSIAKIDYNDTDWDYRVWRNEKDRYYKERYGFIAKLKNIKGTPAEKKLAEHIMFLNYAK